VIDRQARTEAVHALRRFIDCATTNDEYESEYPLPEIFGRRWGGDRAIRAIYEFSWSWFDDFDSHRLEGKYALPDDFSPVAERCVLFLRTDCDYEWKEEKFIGSGLQPSHLLTLGLMTHRVAIDEQLAAHLDQAEGEAHVWPFFRLADYEIASKKPSSALLTLRENLSQ
jgi:hypothetical protein